MYVSLFNTKRFQTHVIRRRVRTADFVKLPLTELTTPACVLLGS